jgi:hypothetical protein
MPKHEDKKFLSNLLTTMIEANLLTMADFHKLTNHKMIKQMDLAECKAALNALLGSIHAKVFTESRFEFQDEA